MPEPSCPSAERWQQYLEEALPAAEQAELSAHLDECPACRRTLDKAAGDDSLLRAARDVGRQQADPPEPPSGSGRPGGAADGGEARAVGPAAALDFLAPPGKPGSLGRLGQYEVLAEIGRGGMGIVLRGFDEVLHRVVAIKVLAPELAGSATARQRFLREAQAAAAVRHDHIIDIHAVGDQPLPHLVMEYIAGQTLQQKLDRVGPLGLREVLRIGHQIAGGLAAAHALGLIHRDVKPSNVLLENGVERVKLTDFGLARAVDDASLTQSGVIAGTPQYMAPEQADGRAVDQRSDLFSLGSVLYVMCTGRLPFRAGTTMAVLKRVCEDTPRPVREINGETPEWLAAIIAKLHAKQPAERFQSAQEVADLLARYLSELQVHGEVLTAGGKTSGQADREKGRQGGKVTRRYASWFLLLLAGVSVAGLTAVLLLWLNRPGGTVPPGPGQEQADPARPNRPRSPEELRRLPSPLDKCKRQDIPPDLLALAGGGDPAQAPAELVAVLQDNRFPERASGVLSVACSPDGQRLASGGEDDTVRLWDLAAGKPLWVKDRHTHPVWAVVFSPDGTLLASGSSDRTIVLWDVATGKEVRTLTGHSGQRTTLAFRPDGQTLAAGEEDGSVKFWDVATGKAKEPLRRHTGPVQAVAFSADGTRLASAGQDQTVQLGEVDTGRHLSTFPTGAPVTNVAFSADGKLLAATGDAQDPVLRLWDLATKKEKVSPVHLGAVSGLSLHPAGGLAATGAEDGTVRFWDLASAPLRSLFVPPGPFGAKVHALAFTPEGRYLATANDNGTMTILRVPEPPGPYQPAPAKKLPDPAELAKQPSPADALQRADIPEDVLKKAGGGDKDKAPAQLVAVLAADGLTKQVTTVAFSPDGKNLAWAGDDGVVVLWDLAAGQLRAALPGHEDKIQSVAFSPDGKTLASAGWDRVVRLWDVASGQAVRVLKGHGGTVSCVAFSPDGRRLASAGHDGTVRLWDRVTGAPQRLLLGSPLNWALAFSADSQTLVAGSEGTIHLWDVASGWELASLPGRWHVRRVAFHPDGQALLASGSASWVELWDLGTGQVRQALTNHPGCALVATAWRADGSLLATAGSHDGTVRLWDLTATPPRGQAIPLFPPGPLSLHDVALSPEGRYLATANPDGTVYLLRLAGPGEVYQVPTD